MDQAHIAIDIVSSNNTPVEPLIGDLESVIRNEIGNTDDLSVDVKQVRCVDEPRVRALELPPEIIISYAIGVASGLSSAVVVGFISAIRRFLAKRPELSILVKYADGREVRIDGNDTRFLEQLGKELTRKEDVVPPPVQS